MFEDNPFGPRWIAGRWLLFPFALLATLAVGLFISLPGTGHSNEPASAERLFRLAFSSSMFTEVKVDDARAAMKAWMLAVARERGIPIDPEPKVYDSVEEMERMLQSGLVEGFAATAVEIWHLSNTVALDRMIVAINANRITEEYVVLVHRDSGIDEVAQLRGRRLLFLQNPRMSLATVWLDTVLMQKGFESTTRFCGTVTSLNKLSLVVLPVFFRQSDACLVTRRGFETMSELNPQVGKLLRILAVSPELVPSGFAFRSASTSPFTDKMLREMARLSESPAGQQILTLIQADRVEERPFSCLSGALELLSTHQRLTLLRAKAKHAGHGAIRHEASSGVSR